ncbi:MAG: hypothetical protein AVO33_07590 [delta proteobacterium ML8_F1]|nr:MAG: hypothetical protein AVO33_07590 [delta proteobacterium ML8_F1]
MSRVCSVGGQALIEGILMRHKNKMAIVIRRKNGELVVKRETIKAPVGKIKGLPFIRGLFMLGSSMKVGIKALTLSASYFEEDDGTAVTEDRFEIWMRKIFKERAEDVLVAFSIFTALLMAVVLFTALPTVIISFLRGLIDNVYVLSALEGVLKMVFFLTYVLLISQMKDVKRVFQYHGAEHKTIHCLEAQQELTVENVRRFTTLHPRCGTSFLLFVLIISIVIFSFITWSNIWMRIGLKVLLLPLIAGISYEVLRVSGNSDSSFVKIISKPGLWMQKITTKEPDDAMLEVAITATLSILENNEC